MTPVVYCDMDGVLADFEGAFADFFTVKFGKGWKDIPREEWKRLSREWPTFWADLDFAPHGQELWRAISKYHPSLLTARPDSWPSAATGKTIWAKRMLPKFGYHPSQQVYVVLRAEKRNFARQPDGTPNFLIDDMEKNIAEWESAGGVGFVYIPSGSAPRQVEAAIAQHMIDYP